MDVERYARLNTVSTKYKNLKPPERSVSIPMDKLSPQMVARLVADMPWDLATLPMACQNSREVVNGDRLSNTADSLIDLAEGKIAATTTKTIVGEVQDLADELWIKLTWSIKQTVRGACSEVLRRTDDPSHEEQTCWMWDDDAQLLD